MHCVKLREDYEDTTLCRNIREVCRSSQVALFSSTSSAAFNEVEEIERMADNDTPLHFSFSGTGPAMFSWMVGFSHGLQESGILSSSSTDDSNNTTHHFMGISGGSMCATLLAAELDFSSNSDVMLCGQEQSDRCRDGKQTLGMLVHNMLDDLLDNAAVQRIFHNKRRKIHIAMVDAPSGSLMKAYNQPIKLCSNFTDKEDIIDAVLAATHLPYIANGNKTTMFRGREVVDAGITGQMFVPATGANFVNVNIFPPPLDSTSTNKENIFGQYVLNMYSRFNNKANGTIHVHPYLANGFALNIFGLDDMLLRPLEKDEALRRHHLGHQSFLSWSELYK
jgi:hypothetical protein